MDDTGNAFPAWLDRHLTEREWEVSDLAKRAGISPSIIFRWRKGYRPNIGNARAIARVLGVSLLEVLVMAGQITSEEAQATVTPPPSVNDLDTVELTAELHRRAEQATNTPALRAAEPFDRDALLRMFAEHFMHNRAGAGSQAHPEPDEGPRDSEFVVTTASGQRLALRRMDPDHEGVPDTPARAEPPSPDHQP